MKRLFLVLAVAVIASCTPREEKAAVGVIKRTFGEMPSNVIFKYVPDSIRFFSTEVSDGRLTVSGSSTVALCKGFHEYIQNNGYGCVTWSGSRLQLPDSLPQQELIRVESPFDVHLFYNVCTFGYSTAYWGWDQWQKDLDWLALHGFDMPLAPIGTEAILWRVYEKMGLSEDEIKAYFSGPGHFPWMRMGNMCAQDGGMSRKWHKEQIKLEHKILGRMAELGMTPVFQGFAGFVPEAVETHFPDVRITRNDWHGLHNQLLNATDSLFQVIGREFILEWEKEFGKGKYYLVDSFNEMDIPFGERGTAERYETIRSYAAATYESIHSANPDAIWVMQGWMFGRDRKKIWDPESVKALLDGAPDDKLIIVDLAVDFNEYVWRSAKDWDYLDGFNNKRWIWSTTPNFGGRTTLKGNYSFYLNAQFDALNSPNKGRLFGYGSSPEGIESNEALYEAISSAGWSDGVREPSEFLSQYFASCYGCTREKMEPFAEGLLASVYDFYTSSDKYDWMIRPGNITPNTFNVTPEFYAAVKHLASLAGELYGSELYTSDLITFAAAAAASRADDLYRKINVLIACKRFEEARTYEEQMLKLLGRTDALLECHPLTRMQRWLDMADKSATNADEQLEFRKEALRLVTTWDAESIHDYACRLWSGLVRDYYIPRLEAYFEACENGTQLDISIEENDFIDRVALNGFSAPSLVENPVESACAIIRYCTEFDGDQDVEDVVGFWNPYTYAIGHNLTLKLSKTQFVGMKGLRFEPYEGESITIEKFSVGNRRVTYPAGPEKTMTGPSYYPYAGPASDNGVEDFTPVKISYETLPQSSGVIRLVK